jgi:prepilin-type N-terminal cleavage/methylation domain-containing protein
MNARRGGRRRGFTLVELMIASSVMAMAIGFVLYTFISYQRAFAVGYSYIGVRNEIRRAMDSMARDIRWTVEPVATHGGHATSGTCLVLKVPAIDASKEIIDVENAADYFVYRLNGNTLERIVTGLHPSSGRQGGTTVVARGVTSLTFTLKDRNNSTTLVPADACAVEISLSVGDAVAVVSSVDYAGKPAETAQTERLATTVTFRNTAARST